MDALVSYSDEEVEDRKPSKRIKTEPHEDVTVALSRAEITKVPPKAGPGASLLPKREVHSPSIPSRTGFTSSTPLVVRQHRPPNDNPKETKTLPRAPEAVQAGSSKERFSLPALTGVSADRSPLASWKGKERARDEEDSAMTPAELEAAYRRLVRPEPNRSGDPEWGLPMVPREGADPKLEGKLANFHTLKTEGTHFNTSLMRSHAFHNPHIYAKLVSFVDIEETGSNYPAMTSPGAWNPYDPELLRTGDAHTIGKSRHTSPARS
ncbi:hypothetical protein OC845_005711 [Tilletia horrida]|nr:hypothetical protein OC845_005711 [Tilletia horrida]